MDREEGDVGGEGKVAYLILIFFWLKELEKKN